MTSTKALRGIMTIDDNTALDTSMTLIVGIKTDNGLIVACDGLTGYNHRGLEHLPMSYITGDDKFNIVAKNVIYAVSGSKVNFNIMLRNNITRLIADNPKASLLELARAISEHLPKLYVDSINDDEFYIELFFAGYTPDKNEFVMYTISPNKVTTNEASYPYLTVGSDDEHADKYIERRYKDAATKEEAMSLLKDTILETSLRIPQEVGGHIFVYEVTNNGTTRLE